MKTLIQVTQKHINKGCKDNSSSCPVALALKEKGFDILVGSCTMENTKVDINPFKVSNIYYHYPRSVKRFVEKFDTLGKNAVKPFKFYLKEKK